MHWNASSNYYSNRNLNYVLGGYKPANLHKWGPGVRDVYALHYIMSGKGVLETGGKYFQLCAGESFIIFPQTEVYYYPDPDDPWEYVWNEFKGDEVPQLLAMTELTLDKPVVKNAPASLYSYYHLVWNGEAKPFEQIRSDARLRLLLSYYIQYYPKEAAVPVTDYVWLAKQYIEHNYWRSSLMVADIVKAVKIERSYLFRLFKEATGMSISGYITAYRIQRACELLKSSNLSVKSVAYSVGYHDQLYFSKVFKKATSYTPSEYMMLHASY